MAAGRPPTAPAQQAGQDAAASSGLARGISKEMRTRNILLALVGAAAVVAAIVATVLLAQQGADLPDTAQSPEASPPTPAETDQSAAEPSPAATLSPSGARSVAVSQVVGAGDAGAELVIIHNSGELINLKDWMLSGAERDAFVFPDLTLFPGGEVRVRSTSGTSGPATLYWGRTAPAWERGELITLTNAQGDTVDTYLVP